MPAIIPPPTTTFPWQNTTDCPFVIALCFSLKLTLTFPSFKGEIIASAGLPEYLTLASTVIGSSNLSNGIKFTSLATKSVLNMSSSGPITTSLVLGFISVTNTGLPSANPKPFL